MKRTIKEQDEGLKAYPTLIDAELQCVVIASAIVGMIIGTVLTIMI